MSASSDYDCELFFPSHEEVNEPWAMLALSTARFEARYCRNLVSAKPAANLRTWTDADGTRWEQWSYKCKAL